MQVQKYETHPLRHSKQQVSKQSCSNIQLSSLTKSDFGSDFDSGSDSGSDFDSGSDSDSSSDSTSDFDSGSDFDSESDPTVPQETSGQWRIFFYITAGIYLGGALIFILIGSGEEQPWARGAPSVFSTATQEQTISVQGPACQTDDRSGDVTAEARGEKAPLVTSTGPPPAYTHS